MTDDDKATQDYSGWGAGIAIGVGVGTALGVAMDNIGAGIAIGVGFGMALAIAFTEAAKRKRANGSPDDKPPGEKPLDE